MKLSIITIVLNDVEHIEKTILSVINQPDISLEYIIIDGGSADGTLDIVKKYENHIAYWISEPDDGVGDAFNKGISHATGEVIGLVNSGDFLEPDALLQVQNAFHENNVEIVYGNVQYWNENEKEYIYNADHTKLKQFMSINHPAVFIKNETYKQYGKFDQQYRIALDYELMLRFLIKGATFKYINTVLSNMALGGLSDINWQKAYHEVYEIKKHYHIRTRVYLYVEYMYQLFKRHISNTLNHFGLGIIIQWYRKHLSSIKKHKAA